MQASWLTPSGQFRRALDRVFEAARHHPGTFAARLNRAIFRVSEYAAKCRDFNHITDVTLPGQLPRFAALSTVGSTASRGDGYARLPGGLLRRSRVASHQFFYKSKMTHADHAERPGSPANAGFRLLGWDAKKLLLFAVEGKADSSLLSGAQNGPSQKRLLHKFPGYHISLGRSILS